MFTGIIETTGRVKDIESEGSNSNFTIESAISNALKVDQSLSHNGVCLTVVKQTGEEHTVTAVFETLQRSSLSDLKVGDLVNLERAMSVNGRLDGHLVQGHVDSVGRCKEIRILDGSWYFTFSYPKQYRHLLVDKGSIAVNGVSLTLVAPTDDQFSVAIIPYTYDHTNFKTLALGDAVNLEFDIIGKYVNRYVSLYKS